MDYKIFGCKTNRYFTEKWLASDLLQDKKGIFIASCVVTDKAKVKWVRFVRQKIAKLQEGEKIYLSGCGTIKNGEIDESFYEIYPELIPYKEKIVLLAEDPEKENTGLGKRSELNLKEKVAELRKGTQINNLFTRKYIVIQNGCDNFCTFCLTVQARGRHKSRDIDTIVDEINAFEKGGGKEVVFTGTNLGAWGAKSSNDFKDSRFVEFLTEVLDRTTISRIRISSLGVEFLSDELIELFAHPRINAYVHLSVQSGSSKILKSMNRHYDRDTLLSVLTKLGNLQRSDGALINIGADLIVGFPGETEDDFRQTLDIVENYGITQLHAFPFSPHKDHYSVPAGSFKEQLDEKTKQVRLGRLMKAGEESMQKFLRKNDGKTLSLLIEKYSPDSFSGWSQNYIELTEKNFLLTSEQKLGRGVMAVGTYKFL